jgi:hypothetical protein
VTMKALVLTQRHHLEILRVVVLFVAIQMVNALVVTKASAELALHHEPVLQHVSLLRSGGGVVRSVHADVPVTVHATAAAPAVTVRSTPSYGMGADERVRVTGEMSKCADSLRALAHDPCGLSAAAFAEATRDLVRARDVTRLMWLSLLGQPDRVVTVKKPDLRILRSHLLAAATLAKPHKPKDSRNWSDGT